MANQSKLMPTSESTLAHSTPLPSSSTPFEFVILSDSDTELDDSDSDKENEFWRVEDGNEIWRVEDPGTVDEVVQAQQGQKEYSHKERIRVHILREVGWTMREISKYTKIPLGSIHYICTTPVTPRNRRGRMPLLNTPTRRQLIDFVQQSAANRRMPFLEVAYHCGKYIS